MFYFLFLYRNGSWFSCWKRAHFGCTEQPGAWQLNNQSTCHQCTKRSQSTNSWGESIVFFFFFLFVALSFNRTTLNCLFISCPEAEQCLSTLSDLEMFIKWPSKRMYRKLIENVMNHSGWVKRFRNYKQSKPKPSKDKQSFVEKNTEKERKQIRMKVILFWNSCDA